MLVDQRLGDDLSGRHALALGHRGLLEQAEEDLLGFYRFPASHRTKLRSTNPLERFNKEIGRRADVVGIFPNDASAIRLIGAMVIEQNDCVSGWEMSSERTKRLHPIPTA